MPGKGSPNGAAAQAVDDWNQHWSDFGAAAEIGPTPKYRRRLIFELLRGMPREGMRMLEIGSGTGEFAEQFCERYPAGNFLGLELSRVGVATSRRRVPRAQFVERDLLQPAKSEEGQDFAATHALCTEVLEHLDEPQRLLKNAAGYMAPGCRLIVTVPGGPMNAFYKHIGHRRHYAPREMRALLEGAGFTVEKTYGAGFPFFNLFRLLITLRGDKFIQSVAGPPSLATRMLGPVFDVLFRLNLMCWGWQTIAVARYRGAAQSPGRIG